MIPLPAINLFRLPSVAAAASAAVALSAQETIRDMRPVIDGLIEHGVLATVGWPTFLPRISADMARALGEADADERDQFARDALTRLQRGARPVRLDSGLGN